MLRNAPPALGQHTDEVLREMGLDAARIGALRAQGVEAYFTMDAGPNVKVLCQPADEPAVAAALRAEPTVRQLISCGPGPAVSFSACGSTTETTVT